MLYPHVPRALGCVALSLAACARPVPSVADGRSLYLANGCASGHGPSGSGDGPIAAKLSDPPTDLRNAAHFQRGSGEAQIAKTLAEGVLGAAAASDPHLHHTHHELAMPKFDHLTDMERRSIALYVISLRTRSVQP
jgi:high-affinity iron transporter